MTTRPGSHRPEWCRSAGRTTRRGTTGTKGTFFRFPAADDPAPSTRRVLLMSLYASALGLAGVGLGVRGFVSVLSGTAPGFYVPVLALVGLISVALVVGAFLSIHRRVLPFLLLVAAAVPLAGDFWLAGRLSARPRAGPRGRPRPRRGCRRRRRWTGIGSRRRRPRTRRRRGGRP